jgi:hypothetical protein
MMNAVEEPRFPEVDHWLSVATRKLCSTSKERIRREIEEHYFEAIDAAKSQGSGEAAARRRAIESLGDPRSAARSFRRHHLTKFQAGFVRGLGEKRSIHRFYLWGIVMILFLAMNFIRVSNVWDLGIYLGMFSVMLAAFVAHFWWTRWFYRHQQARASLTLDMFSTWVFFASMQFGSSLLWYKNMVADAFVYGAALLFLLTILAVLLRKMSDRPPKSA